MMNIFRAFKKIDLFGVFYFPTIEGSDKKFKSSLGGLFTLFIYLTSFAYLIYMLV